MVYQKLNLGLTSREINYSIPRFYTADDLLQGLTNDLETVTLAMHPVLDQFKALLIQSGARGALMSGSGPTVFGVFAEEEAAFRAEEVLLRQGGGFTVFVAHSL
jgi:4-diphosphocytidyl-2-C-methyl-D-erythritol kinase